jgi:hypothetical protein
MNSSMLTGVFTDKNLSHEFIYFYVLNFF